MDQLPFYKVGLPENQQGKDSSYHVSKSEASHSPLILVKHGMSSNTRTIYNIAEDKSYCLKEINQFKGMRVCGSSHGWLVMVGTDDSDCFLFNPSTLEKIGLPSGDLNGWCILSSPPTDGESCTILSLEGGSRISFCSLGDTEWNHLVYEDESLFQFTVCKGKFYFLGFPGTLLVLDFFKIRRLVGKIESCLPRSNSLVPESVTFNRHLLGSSGDIYLVHFIHVGHGGRILGAIEVFKMDELKMVWTRVKCLDDLCFLILLGTKNCMSRRASEAGLKGNSIYFMHKGADRSLYRYDMEERRIYMTLPCPNLEPEWDEDDSIGPYFM